jgi:hypothetical protein
MHRTSLLLAFVLGAISCESGDLAGEPPAAPTDLDGVPLDGGAHLTWVDASDDEAEFAIERKGATGDFDEIDTVPFDTATYHDATPMAGMTYTYRVIARNGAGESDPSNHVMVSF